VNPHAAALRATLSVARFPEPPRPFRPPALTKAHLGGAVEGFHFNLATIVFIFARCRADLSELRIAGNRHGRGSASC
jgi:hypothetical protein